MQQNILLLSIRPEYAESILSGTKTVELRRTRPRVSAGDSVLIYISAPTMALSGKFEVADVISTTPSSLWRKVRTQSGITRKEFNEYYAGASVGYGIIVGKVWAFQERLPLNHLRKKIPGFHPPQGYLYLSRHDTKRLGAFSSG